MDVESLAKTVALAINVPNFALVAFNFNFNVLKETVERLAQSSLEKINRIWNFAIKFKVLYLSTKCQVSGIPYWKNLKVSAQKPVWNAFKCKLNTFSLHFCHYHWKKLFSTQMWDNNGFQLPLKTPNCFLKHFNSYLI